MDNKTYNGIKPLYRRFDDLIGITKEMYDLALPDKLVLQKDFKLIYGTPDNFTPPKTFKQQFYGITDNR